MESAKFESTSGDQNPLNGLTKIVRMFEQRGGDVDSLSPILAEELVERVLERFELQSGFRQGAWQKLADETLKARRQSKEPKMLRDTGVMMGSITPHAEGPLSEAYTNVPYAKYHVSKEPRSKIPLRDFFDIDLGAVADYAAELMLAEITG